jgi:transposase-like protein
MIPTPYGPMTVSDAARQFGVNRNTIFRRIRDGWPRERLIEPAQFHPRWHNTQETQ